MQHKSYNTSWQWSNPMQRFLRFNIVLAHYPQNKNWLMVQPVTLAYLRHNWGEITQVTTISKPVLHIFCSNVLIYIQTYISCNIYNNRDNILNKIYYNLLLEMYICACLFTHCCNFSNVTSEFRIFNQKIIYYRDKQNILKTN